MFKTLIVWENARFQTYLHADQFFNTRCTIAPVTGCVSFPFIKYQYFHKGKRAVGGFIYKPFHLKVPFQAPCHHGCTARRMSHIRTVLEQAECQNFSSRMSNVTRVLWRTETHTDSVACNMSNYISVSNKQHRSYRVTRHNDRFKNLLQQGAVITDTTFFWKLVWLTSPSRYTRAEWITIGIEMYSGVIGFGSGVGFSFFFFFSCFVSLSWICCRRKNLQWSWHSFQERILLSVYCWFKKVFMRSTNGAEHSLSEKFSQPSFALVLTKS